MRDRRSDTSIAENGNHRPEIKHGLSAVGFLEFERDQAICCNSLVSQNHTFFVYFSVPIEISPTPNLYVVEFEFERPHLGISVVLLAARALMAKLKAWRLFPERRRSASQVRLCCADGASTY